MLPVSFFLLNLQHISLYYYNYEIHSANAFFYVLHACRYDGTEYG